MRLFPTIPDIVERPPPTQNVGIGLLAVVVVVAAAAAAIRHRSVTWPASTDEWHRPIGMAHNPKREQRRSCEPRLGEPPTGE